MLNNKGLNIDLSPGVHRLVSASLLLVGIFSMWGLIFKPLIHLTNQAVDQLYDARFELTRAKSLSEELSRLAKQDIAVEETELKSLLLWTEAQSNKESTIQEVVDQIIRKSRFNLESMRIASTTSRGSIVQVSIEIKGNGDESSVIEMMSEIERNKPLIVIDQFNLRASNSIPIDQTFVVTKLDVDLRLSGFGSDITTIESITP